MSESTDLPTNDAAPSEDEMEDVERPSVSLDSTSPQIVGLTPNEFEKLTVMERMELLFQERQFQAEERERLHGQKHRRISTLLLAVGLFFGVGTAGGTVATLYITQDQIRIAQEAQITDRYAKTIEALSSEDPSVRLGALRALKRLMDDSPRDRDAITAVLVAYLHQRASPKRGQTDVEPGSDLEAAITVLADRPDPRPLPSLNLHAFSMYGIQLPESDLRGAWLCSTRLYAANLRGIDLRNAVLHLGDLEDVNLEGADLRNANLGYTNLTSADLRGANLNGADLRYADLTSADLRGADLRNTNLDGTKLDGAKLDGAILKRANLDSTGGDNVELRRANLDSTNPSSTGLAWTNTSSAMPLLDPPIMSGCSR